MKAKREVLRVQNVSETRTIGGYWQCAVVFRGERRSCCFNGYSKREAVRRFVRDLNGKGEL